MKHFRAVFAVALVLSVLPGASKSQAAEAVPFCQLTYVDRTSDQPATLGLYQRERPAQVAGPSECVALARKALGEKFECMSSFDKHPHPRTCTASRVHMVYRYADSELKLKMRFDAKATEGSCHVEFRKPGFVAGIFGPHLKIQLNEGQDLEACITQVDRGVTGELKEARFQSAAQGVVVQGTLKAGRN